MTDNRTSATTEEYQDERTGRRQRAIDAYSGARERVTGTLGESPFIALAGGIAAGALIAALLPRTATETRAIRPTARRVKDSARSAFKAAKDTGGERLSDFGLSPGRAEETIRSLIRDVAEAAKASGQAALDAGRKG